MVKMLELLALDLEKELFFYVNFTKMEVKCYILKFK